MDRRSFLRLAAGATASATLLPTLACGGSDRPKRAGAKTTEGHQPTLRIATWVHFVPAYDVWFDDEYTRRWGEENDVTVVVDHIPLDELGSRADAERSAGAGHDLFAFISPAARFADDVIDHTDIVEEISRRAGPMTPMVERTVRNAKTGRYFAVPDWWGAQVAYYRTDLWEPTGLLPKTWDDVRQAAPALRSGGHPMGIGFSRDYDSHLGLGALLLSYGGSIQGEGAFPTIGGAATVEAVKVATELFRRGMTDEVLTWDSSSDNRLLASGAGSLTFDPPSALRAIELQNTDLARTIGLAAMPEGPAGRFAPTISQAYSIWRFAEQPDLARRFLIDLASDRREPFLRSGFYNLPAFPGGLPDLADLLAADLVADPKGKYSPLVDAASWTTNFGHPGHDNPAVDEVLGQAIIPKMFAAAARGEMTPEEAVAAAEAQARPIFEKWRERGKI